MQVTTEDPNNRLLSKAITTAIVHDHIIDNVQDKHQSNTIRTKGTNSLNNNGDQMLELKNSLASTFVSLLVQADSRE